MSAETKDGGQAFPRPGVSGMTLRDYFAAQALPAIITIRGLEGEWHSIAAAAYWLADRMLAECATPRGEA